MIAGLILAGGASRRMGSPKPLLTVGGETFLDRLIGVLAPHCDPVVVVLGYEADTIRGGLRRAGQARFVANPHPERGQLSSLQCGLRAIPAEADGVMYLPVDYPLVEASTVAALAAEAADMRLHAVVAPECEGKHGHPVCVSRQLVAEILALPEGATARDVIHRWRHRARYLPVSDRGVLRDIDDPAAYNRLVSS